MFETLIESRAAGIRPGPSVVWSAVLHALLAAGAVLATRQAAFMIDQDGNDPGVDWLLPPPPLPPATPITETAEAIDLPARPERWFETVPTIGEVPMGIPSRFWKTGSHQPVSAGPGPSSPRDSGLVARHRAAPFSMIKLTNQWK